MASRSKRGSQSGVTSCEVRGKEVLPINENMLLAARARLWEGRGRVWGSARGHRHENDACETYAGI